MFALSECRNPDPAGTAACTMHCKACFIVLRIEVGLLVEWTRLIAVSAVSYKNFPTAHSSVNSHQHHQAITSSSHHVPVQTASQLTTQLPTPQTNPFPRPGDPPNVFRRPQTIQHHPNCKSTHHLLPRALLTFPSNPNRPNQWISITASSSSTFANPSRCSTP